MRQILIAALATIAVHAADHNLYNHSISIVGGYTINSAESYLDNEFSWGLRYNYNRTTVEDSIDIDVIQVAFDHSIDTPYQNLAKGILAGETDIYRLGANALWYMENDSDFTPFVLLGAGLQFFGEDAAEDSNNVLFATIGAGVEYQLRGDFSAVAEVKGMFAGDDADYISGTVGFKYSFGQNYKPVSQTTVLQSPTGTVIRY